MFKWGVAEEAFKAASRDVRWRLMVDETLVIFKNSVSAFGMRMRRRFVWEEY
jgi:hypothetical protein